jgi:hypothetical protein
VDVCGFSNRSHRISDPTGSALKQIGASNNQHKTVESALFTLRNHLLEAVYMCTFPHTPFWLIIYLRSRLVSKFAFQLIIYCYQFLPELVVVDLLFDLVVPIEQFPLLIVALDATGFQVEIVHAPIFHVLKKGVNFVIVVQVPKCMEFLHLHCIVFQLSFSGTQCSAYIGVKIQDPGCCKRRFPTLLVNP